MVGEQVRFETEQVGKLGGRQVGQREGLDDCQPVRITQCSMHRCTPLQVQNPLIIH